jgi:tetratricopeptide (TPR) repeat protein
LKHKNTTQVLFAVLAAIIIFSMVGGLICSAVLPQAGQSAVSVKSNNQASSAELQQKLKDTQQYLKNNPQDKNALLDLAALYLQTGQYQAASETAKTVLSMDPNNIEGHYFLGIALASNNPSDKTGAITEMQTVKKLDPSGQYGAAADKVLQQLQPK